MNIGLFFGSFNPIHTGHLIIASTALNNLPLAEVWFVVSPQNPLKNAESLLNAEARLLLAKQAIEDDKRFLLSDAEFSLPIPSYTSDTIDFFEKKFPERSFALIMGSDSFLQLDKWKNGDKLLKKHIVVYLRPGFEITNPLPTNISLIKAPLLNISATVIRSLIKEGKNIKYLVPEKVQALIEQQQFYK